MGKASAFWGEQRHAANQFGEPAHFGAAWQELRLGWLASQCPSNRTTLVTIPWGVISRMP